MTLGKSNRGYLLTEALVSLALLGFGFAAVLASFQTAQNVSTREKESDGIAICAQKVLLASLIGLNEVSDECTQRSTWTVELAPSEKYSMMKVIVDNEQFEAIYLRN